MEKCLLHNIKYKTSSFLLINIIIFFKNDVTACYLSKNSFEWKYYLKFNI